MLCISRSSWQERGCFKHTMEGPYVINLEDTHQTVEAMINPILNKGGFGKSYSREETVRRIRPLAELHHRLVYAYLYAIEHLSDREAAARLDALQPQNRTDGAKLMEVIYANGGYASTGTELELEQMNLGPDDVTILRNLMELEQTFHEKVKQEYEDKTHQIRTLAILENVFRHSEERLEAVKALQKQTV